MFTGSAQALVDAARGLVNDGAVLAGVRGVYRLADAAVAARRPVCHQCGRCCRFDRCGHSLFVSTAEVALFLRMNSLSRIEGPIHGTCPFLRLDPARCAARQPRPLGCRLYYCDASAQRWQQDAYDRLHDRLRRVHQALQVPYFYAEWLAVLRSAAPGCAP